MKIKDVLLSAFLVLGFGTVSLAQEDEVLMTIDGDKVTREEFVTIYKKNNQDSAITKESLDEYLDLFINFKLKVKEAENLGLDTSRSFQQELAQYREQLAKPYLSDKEMKEELIQEAHERLKKEVRAKHILVKAGANASPKDTLQAYKKIMEAKKRVNDGESFEKVAQEVSEDPSVKKNKGDLGYFTAFQMVYPFESAAYEGEVGEVTEPVRTKYGYHLVKVIDKRKARGRIKVAHIMIRSTDKMNAGKQKNAKKKIYEIHQKLKNEDGNFSNLARKFSEDRRSARKGGQLPWFHSGEMVPPFEDAAFALKDDGAISEPVKTRYGWHIIKRLDFESVGSLEDMRSKIKKKVNKSSRSNISQESFLKKLKKEYDFQFHEKQLNTIIQKIDSSIFAGKWSSDKVDIDKEEPLFELNGREFPTKGFLNYLEKNQRKQPTRNVESYIRKQYDAYEQTTIREYEKSRLDEKYPEFKALMNEYRDGILLFNLSDKNVWSKAVEDTIGLEKYYKKNKRDYMWEERIDATIYRCKNEEIAAKVRSLIDDGVEPETIRDTINQDSQLNVTVKSDRFEKDDRPFLDSVKWKEGLSRQFEFNGRIVFIDIHDVIKPKPKSLKQAKGLVTSDYQDYLEKKWVKDLRKKYEVDVNKDVLYSIIP